MPLTPFVELEPDGRYAYAYLAPPGIVGWRCDLPGRERLRCRHLRGRPGMGASLRRTRAPVGRRLPRRHRRRRQRRRRQVPAGPHPHRRCRCVVGRGVGDARRRPPLCHQQPPRRRPTSATCSQPSHDDPLVVLQWDTGALLGVLPDDAVSWSCVDPATGNPDSGADAVRPWRWRRRARPSASAASHGDGPATAAAHAHRHAARHGAHRPVTALHDDPDCASSVIRPRSRAQDRRAICVLRQGALVDDAAVVELVDGVEAEALEHPSRRLVVGERIGVDDADAALGQPRQQRARPPRWRSRCPGASGRACSRWWRGRRRRGRRRRRHRRARRRARPRPGTTRPASPARPRRSRRRAGARRSWS